VSFLKNGSGYRRVTGARFRWSRRGARPALPAASGERQRRRQRALPLAGDCRTGPSWRTPLSPHAGRHLSPRAEPTSFHEQSAPRLHGTGAGSVISEARCRTPRSCG